MRFLLLDPCSNDVPRLSLLRDFDLDDLGCRRLGTREGDLKARSC
jgi:hypothetical protein